MQFSHPTERDKTEQLWALQKSRHVTRGSSETELPWSAIHKGRYRDFFSGGLEWSCVFHRVKNYYLAWCPAVTVEQQAHASHQQVTGLLLAKATRCLLKFWSHQRLRTQETRHSKHWTSINRFYHQGDRHRRAHMHKRTHAHTRVHIHTLTHTDALTHTLTHTGVRTHTLVSSPKGSKLLRWSTGFYLPASKTQNTKCSFIASQNGENELLDADVFVLASYLPPPPQLEKIKSFQFPLSISCSFIKVTYI